MYFEAVGESERVLFCRAFCLLTPPPFSGLDAVDLKSALIYKVLNLASFGVYVNVGAAGFASISEYVHLGSMHAPRPC